MADPQQHRPSTLARNGVVSAPHYLAAQAGVQILQAGGNALDAAIAANATLNVVYPILCGTGGDLFILLYDAKTGSLHALDACGGAGSRATPAYFRDRGFDAIPRRGPLAVSVPGLVDGWQMASERFGRLGLAAVLQPAIAHAEDGFGVTPYLHRSLGVVAAADWSHASWRKVYAPDGTAPAAGSILRVPELGRSLRLIAEQGRDVFYRGEIGRALVDFLAAEGGLLTHDDLAAHHGRWVEPLSIDYRGYRIDELPPPTQGVTALQALKLAEGLSPRGEPAGAGNVHLLVEAKKLAWADRQQYLGDPDYMTVDPRRLLDDAYLERRRALIDPERAREDVTAGTLDGDTIYLCAADREGNAVSLIQSNYNGVGSGLVVPGYGIQLQNRGCYFSLEPGHPNVVAPRKRPLHTLIPSMALRDGRPAIVFGSMGGDGQAQTHLQVYTNLIDFGLEIQAAIEAPRWVHARGEGSPPGLIVEDRFPATTIARLRALGHEVTVADGWSSLVGHAHGIVIDPATGLLAGGADPRADSAAAGW